LSRSLAPLRSLRGATLAPRALLPSAPTPVRLPSASESRATDRVGPYWFRPPPAWLTTRPSRSPPWGLPRSAVCMRSVNALMHALPGSWAPLRSSGVRASHEPRPCGRKVPASPLRSLLPSAHAAGRSYEHAAASQIRLRCVFRLSQPHDAFFPIPALSVSFTGLAPSGLLPSEVCSSTEVAPPLDGAAPACRCLSLPPGAAGAHRTDCRSGSASRLPSSAESEYPPEQRRRWLPAGSILPWALAP
jgi:hypothetical protein